MGSLLKKRLISLDVPKSHFKVAYVALFMSGMLESYTMAWKSRLIPFYLCKPFCLKCFYAYCKLRHDQLLIPEIPEASVWLQVDSEVRELQSVHQRYWWRHSGYPLAILLCNASYSVGSQYQYLKFFASVVASSLGVTPGAAGDQLSWPSFMTDDGIPIELSWDWGTGDKSPTIRYSIEPVGLNAGTSLDRYNQYAASKFHCSLLGALPGVSLEWFDHFKENFDCDDCSNRQVQEGHCSQVFYAFDLTEPNVTSKAYFFPAPKARANRQTKLAAISQAITAAPHCTAENLRAFSTFEEYASEPNNATLELEILAIDLIEPLKSRFKVYFRSRDTNFSSVIRVMTLGGRVNPEGLEKGLDNLRHLWNAVLEVDNDLDKPLQQTDHQTAGILYNVEFKLGSHLPATKIYIPVRHYASSDERVINGLNAYLQYHKKNRSMPDYVRALDSLLYVTPQPIASKLQAEF